MFAKTTILFCLGLYSVNAQNTRGQGLVEEDQLPADWGNSARTWDEQEWDADAEEKWIEEWKWESDAFEGMEMPEGVDIGTWDEEDWAKYFEEQAMADKENWDHDMDHDMADWEGEWDKEMGEWDSIDWDKDYWSEGEMAQWEEQQGMGGDWFGELVNDECAPECEVADCEYGQFCILTTCVDPCTGESTCVQDVTFNFEEWEQVDCAEGAVELEQECEEVCEYLECDETHEFDEVCWVEVCDDGCGTESCSVWFQVEGEWYGEYCPEEEGLELPEFRIGDAFGAVMRGGRAYGDTIEEVFTTFCEPDDQECLNGGKDIVNLLSGKLPQQEQVPKEQTEMVSQSVNDGIAQGAAAAKQGIDAYIAPNLDMVLQDPNIKNILNVFIEDTAQNFVEEGEDPQMQVAEVIQNSDSTDQILEKVAPEISVENILRGVRSFFPEDASTSALDELFAGFFSEGDMNEGMDRRGAREDD